ncbi:gamma-glutamyltransferase 5a [Austrofundulus limnaeus]|uniref:Gamma-glutamyltransferase 5a n=1 Tax=Austrofundulus limnaeus TaxID=52670 RepID=A0A2I4BTK7_AUSLI|nr:PREDICTED: gamma-glutamyltransferase 5-like [Austrofundulus limnaeus]
MDSSGEVKIINSRETAPSNMKPDLLESCPKTFQSVTGSKWIAVPGELRGYEKAHKLYGKLPWADLFKPTIKLAREGIKIPEVQGTYIPFISNESSALWDLFSDKNGKLLKTGDIVKFEKLADTLETIANNGADSFYTGKIAKDLIHDIQEAGGTLTLQDLANYNATVTDAWAVPFGEYQMYIPPPPAGGVLLGLILSILKGYQMNSAPKSLNERIQFYHRYIEAFKFVNGQKLHIRDPHVVSDKKAKKLLEDRFPSYIRTLISSNRTHDLQYYNMTSFLDSMGTSHVSVLAEDGSAVSATSTINHIFGSRIRSARTGVILNNEMFDFCGRTDKIFPGERPPSSMAPSVLKSQSKMTVIGASGGAFITTAMASTLINHLWFGKSLKEAIKVPVVYVDSKNTVKFEAGSDEDVIKALKARGHNLEKATKFYNVVNAVEKEEGCICAESDARKLGEAAGY